MITMNVNLSKKEFSQIKEISTKTGLSENEIIKRALNEFFVELEAEFQDLAEAEKIMAEVESGKQKLIPAEEVYKKLGI